MDLREASGENFEQFPPKVRRALLLYVHGFPVTKYLIVFTKEIEYAVHEIRMATEKSRYGIVVRTIPRKDGAQTMSLPYIWLKKSEEVSAEVLRGLGTILMAFAPQATPETAKGVVVGRYVVLFDQGRRVIEYYLDEIRPRVLDRVEKGDPRFGSLVQNPGKFFWAEGGCAEVGSKILRVLQKYDERVEVLGKAIGAQEVCLEVTWNRGRIEFHDFDSRK